jgi:methionyl-tRNA formyltransferase
MKGNLRIIFFGTPAFAAHSLKQMVAAGYHVVAVVTAPDKPAGRGMRLNESEVKKVAVELGLPILQPTNLKDPDFQNKLNQLHADLGVVIAFRMLPQAVWSMPKLGTFNLHASLLPQYRGAAPINHAIINGESETGVTTFFLKHEIDTGDIVLQEKVNISPTDNAGTLHDKLMHKGADLVLNTLALVEKGHWPSHPQVMPGELKAAPKITPEFCILSNDMRAEDALNKIRGLSPYPGAWLPDKTMKVFHAIGTNIEPAINHPEKGTPMPVLVLDHEHRKLLWPFRDRLLELLEVQPQGKKRMTAVEYLNGQVNEKKHNH